MEHFFNELVQQFGIYAVFALCMVEGDITLLLAGVLANTGSFGRYSYVQVVLFGTAGAVTGDFFGYLVGRFFSKNVSSYKFYQHAKPRIESLTEKFGPLSILVSKYIYGIRAAWCIFYGVSGTPWYKFLLHDAISCFLWVLITSGIGYFFGGAVIGLIGDYKRVSIGLLVVLVLGIIGFYLFERFWVTKKIEEVSPETVHEIEKAAHFTLQDIRDNINERLHFTHSNSANGAASANNNHKEIQQSSEAQKADKIEND
ncbi:MAG: DedA family protein [Pyrinomonadaceae bacterium]